MVDFVRIKLPDGTHSTVTRQYAEALGLAALRRPATTRQGAPLPPKFPLRPQRTAPTAPAGGQTTTEEHA